MTQRDYCIEYNFGSKKGLRRKKANIKRQFEDGYPGYEYRFRGNTLYRYTIDGRKVVFTILTLKPELISLPPQPQKSRR
jgi:hypothetical protein